MEHIEWSEPRRHRLATTSIEVVSCRRKEMLDGFFVERRKITKNTEKGGNQCEVSCIRFLPIHLNEDKPDR